MKILDQTYEKLKSGVFEQYNTAFPHTRFPTSHQGINSTRDDTGIFSKCHVRNLDDISK